MTLHPSYFLGAVGPTILHLLNTEGGINQRRTQADGVQAPPPGGSALPRLVGWEQGAAVSAFEAASPRIRPGAGRLGTFVRSSPAPRPSAFGCAHVLHYTSVGTTYGGSPNLHGSALHMCPDCIGRCPDCIGRDRVIMDVTTQTDLDPHAAQCHPRCAASTRTCACNRNLLRIRAGRALGTPDPACDRACFSSGSSVLDPLRLRFVWRADAME